MAPGSRPALLGDIGGTNARFALAVDGAVGAIDRLSVAEFPNPAAALRAYLDRTRPDPPPDRAALAVAGPVADGRARLTNGTWTFSAARLARDLGFEAVFLVNDFAAQARAIPVLRPRDLRPIGGGRPVPGAPVAVIGPGTGLGVASLVFAAEGPLVIATEGGHVTMPAADDREAEILARLRAGQGHVSAERVLSGPGLEALYRTIAETDGHVVPARRAEEITTAAVAGRCPVATAAFDMFCAMLGTVAGDIALTFGARGGVYIAGGILPHLADAFAASRFRERFEDKGRFRTWLAAVPTRLVVRPDPAFLGLAALVAGPATSA